MSSRRVLVGESLMLLEMENFTQEGPLEAFTSDPVVLGKLRPTEARSSLGRTGRGPPRPTWKGSSDLSQSIPQGLGYCFCAEEY